MNALLVYPQHPELTYWSFRGALPYIDRRAALPPLGLLTLAAMLPDDWVPRLVDMNVRALKEADLLWADVVLTSTMVVQAPSLAEVATRARRVGVPIVAGGPHPTASPTRLPHVDHVFLGEAEGGLSTLIHDLERGRAAPVYRGTSCPDLDASPVPRFDLLDLGAYASMAVQQSRGCPFACEFCDVWKLFGRRPRIKSPERVTAELDALEALGWRGSVFFVDDNFIGNRRSARGSLEAIGRWQRRHGFPFRFYTEASVNLGTDDELLSGMRDAGFNFVFLGIESPSVESLAGANKRVNANLDLRRAVRRIQEHGIEVSGGLIVGFDEDTEDIFDRQISLVDEAAIPVAMVGILNALDGTELHDRLRREGRLLGESQGNNTHAFETNFTTRMPAERLTAGYRRVIRTLYEPTLRGYFRRCRSLLDRRGPTPRYSRRVAAHEVWALLRSLRTVLSRRYGRQYLRFVLWCAGRHPARIPEAVRLAIQGFHFESITREAIQADAIRHDSARAPDRFREWAARLSERAGRRGGIEMARLRAMGAARARALGRLRRRMRSLSPDTRAAALRAYGDAASRIDALIAEQFPSMARAFASAARRLAVLRRSFARDVDRFRARYLAVCGPCGEIALDREIRPLRRLRRQALRRARRAVRRLPREYRVAGRLELRLLRQRLDSLLPEASAARAGS